MTAGSDRGWLAALRLDPATWCPPPLSVDDPVALDVALGPRAETPLWLALPLLLTTDGVAAVRMREALAEAAGVSGVGIWATDTAAWSVERAYAARWVLTSATPSSRPAIVRLADMVAVAVPPTESHLARIRALDLKAPLAAVVRASGHVEQDVDLACRAGVDVVVLARATGEARGVSPVLALRRAHTYLRRTGQRASVSLVGAGARTGQDILKLLALGADAVLIDAVVPLAGRHGHKVKTPRDHEHAAEQVLRWVSDVADTLAGGLRAIGYRRLADLGDEVLVASSPSVGRALDLSPVADARVTDSLRRAVKSLRQDYAALTLTLQQLERGVRGVREDWDGERGTS